MKGGGHSVEDERVQKYISMAKQRLSQAQRDRAPQEVVEKARRYLSDAEFYLKSGDTATALASVSYSHGLLDGAVPGARKDGVAEKALLANIFVAELSGKPAAALDGGVVFPISARDSVESLMRRGLLVGHRDSPRLSEKGRARIRVGLAAGVFDLVHPGHIAFLSWAKRHVDVLAVIIARDPNSKRRKGRAPIQPELDRLAVVSKLKPVDYACLGDPHDIFAPVERIRPDIIFLGKDQQPDGRRIRGELVKRGLDAKIMRSRVWDPGTLSKTTRIVQRIKRLSQAV